MVKAIVGANWGDEGKGKITDMLAAKADIVTRFQGGANAGHTIINNYGKFALHQLPSGVCFPHIANVIGNGVALDIPKLMDEIATLADKGVPTPTILVSDRAGVLMPYHKQFDVLEEQRLGKESFGSTKSGIAPFYADKYAKLGFQVSDLFDIENLRSRMERVVDYKNILLKHVYNLPQEDLLHTDELLETLLAYRTMIEPYVADTGLFLSNAVKDGKNILLEGQLGALKDPDHGIYPMVTSSSTLAGFASVGAGVPVSSIKEVVAVTKAYSSAVGAGEFVSEVFGNVADLLRTNGGDAGEYGATTGRPRRMGWFDCVATRYGCRVQGATSVVLTAIDCLHFLDEIPVCVGYEIDGVRTKDFPTTALLKKAKPILTTLRGWKKDIRGVSNFDDLPVEAQEYVKFIEKELEVPINIVSTGPKRDEILFR